MLKTPPWCRWLLIAVVLAGAIWLDISWVPPEPSGQQNAHSPSSVVAPDAATETIAFYTEALAWLTAILALASLWQGVMLLRADKTTRIAAEAAKRQADALIAIESPVVILAELHLRQWADKFAKEPEEFIEFGIPPLLCQIVVVFKNIGRTAATVTGIRLGATVTPRLPDEPKYDVVEDSGSVIQIDGTLRFIPMNYRPIRNREQLDLIEKHAAHLWVYGRLDYKGFGEAKPPVLFARRWRVGAGLGAGAPTGFISDSDAPSNYGD